MKRYSLLCLLVVVGLLAAACGRSEGGTTNDPAGSSTTVAGDEACSGVTLEDTEIGVTADTITVQTMADTGSPLAPGLFQANLDAMEAFAEYVNDNGGIGCRQMKVQTWDSKLTAEESKNGLLNACTTAVALVGGNSLFNPDVTTISDCPDKAGAPTGLPDIAALANDVNEQCSPNAFMIQAVAETCPVVTGQPRDLKAFVGQIEYYESQSEEPLKGIFMVPGDLPTTVQSATYQIVAQQEAGVDITDAVKVSGRDEQSAYTPKVQILKNENGTYVYNGSNDVAMTSMRKEAAAQGLTTVNVWACSIACYTEKFKAAGADVDGTYTWLQFLPFEEASQNEAAQAYVDAVDKPDSFGAQAWQAGMLFKEVIDEIVATDGPNGITRARIIDVLNNKDDFTASGWMGDEPKDLKGMSTCFVVVQLQDGEFVRKFPEEPGTLSCDPSNVTTINLDPAAEAAKIQ